MRHRMLHFQLFRLHSCRATVYAVREALLSKPFLAQDEFATVGSIHFMDIDQEPMSPV